VYFCINNTFSFSRAFYSHCSSSPMIFLKVRFFRACAEGAWKEWVETLSSLYKILFGKKKAALNNFCSRWWAGLSTFSVHFVYQCQTWEENLIHLCDDKG
jgi:hypothetical protein